MVQDKLLQSEISNVINLISNNLFPEALELVEKLLRDHPNNSLILNIMGACQDGLGKYDIAAKFYNKAIKVKPDYAKAHYNLGGTLHNMKKFDDAVDCFKTSLKYEPDHAEAHNNLGNVYRELGEFELALKSFKNALKVKPEYLEAHYSLGLTFQSLGMPESIKHFEKVLKLKSNFAEGYNSLGIAHKSMGQLNKAVKSYKKAIAIKPDFIEAHNNLGNVFRDLVQLNKAMKCYEKAIKIRPDYPTTFNHLGNVQRDLGQFNDAINSYLDAISLNSEDFNTWNNLGLTYRDNGNYDDAIASYKKALLIEPKNSDALNNLGVTYRDNGNYDDAIASYKKALLIEPKNSDALNNIGISYKEIGHPDEAIKYYKKAIKINPDDFDTHNNLGIVFSELGQLDDAIKSYENALKINPKYESAYNNIAIILTKLNRLEDAFKYNRKALQINPKFAEGFAIQGHIFTEMNELDRALESLEIANDINSNLAYNMGTILSTKMNLCHWDGLSKKLIELRSRINNNEKVIVPFDLLSLIDDPKLQGKTSTIYANDQFRKKNILPKIKSHPNHKKIRVGYFSADLRMHPVATLTAELYEVHDRTQFEVHAFSFGPDTNDEMNLRIKKGVDYFHNVIDMTHQEIAMLSRSLEIDIAVDLGGYTADSRTGIFAMLAAPVQVCYIGVLSTMGTDYYDYLIVGSGMIPKENQQFYSEKIAYLPSYQVNDSKESPPDITFSREELGLPKESFVFCCFNNTYKITPTIFDSWARILNNVDNSVMMIYVSNQSAQTNLIKEAIKRGVDPKRFIFSEKLPREEYLARYRLADLFLDTHPYNAGTTASDALRMGLPILTINGDSFNSKEAASIIESVKLPEMITNTFKEYELLAINLANNQEKLQKIKKKLNVNLHSSPLFDTAKFTKNLEFAYTRMHQRCCKGIKPDHIHVID